MLDWLSAAVYLATLKTDCFKAVCRAHREYRKLRKSPDKAETLAYIGQHGDKACVSGIYRKLIILESLLKGDRIFSSIKEKDFYNI